jgi:hypothetical protein
MTNLCTFSPQAGEGVTDGACDWARGTFAPRGCMLPEVSAAGVRRCLRGRTLTFLGDSTVRDFARSLANLLDQMPATDAAHDSSVDASNSSQELGAPWILSAAKGLPAWRPFHPALNQRIQGPGVQRPGAPPGSRGLWNSASHGTHHSGVVGALNVTIRSVADVQKADNWRDIVAEILVQNGRGAGLGTSVGGHAPSGGEHQRVGSGGGNEHHHHHVAFVQLGIHDTTALCTPEIRRTSPKTPCSALVGAPAAVQWKQDPVRVPTRASATRPSPHPTGPSV